MAIMMETMLQGTSTLWRRRCIATWRSPTFRQGDSSFHKTADPTSEVYAFSRYQCTTSAQEVYGKLEEPDGLAGLVRLRQGGATPADHMLAAQKAGAWSEALSLHEQV